MKKLAALALLALAGASFAQTYVSPYTRSDGTYVPGHHRSAPDSTVDNNYGTRGNYNPYTGQSGTEPRSYERPYQAPTPSHSAPSYGQQCGYSSSGRYVCR